MGAMGTGAVSVLRRIRRVTAGFVMGFTLSRFRAETQREQRRREHTCCGIVMGFLHNKMACLRARWPAEGLPHFC